MRYRQVWRGPHLDSTHTAVSLINSHLPEALVSVSSSDSLDVLNLLGDELGHTVLERLRIGSRGGSEGPSERWAELQVSTARRGNCMVELWLQLQCPGKTRQGNTGMSISPELGELIG